MSKQVSAYFLYLNIKGIPTGKSSISISGQSYRKVLAQANCFLPHEFLSLPPPNRSRCQWTEGPYLKKTQHPQMRVLCQEQLGKPRCSPHAPRPCTFHHLDTRQFKPLCRQISGKLEQWEPCEAPLPMVWRPQTWLWISKGSPYTSIRRAKVTKKKNDVTKHEPGLYFAGRYVKWYSHSQQRLMVSHNEKYIITLLSSSSILGQLH